MVFTINNPSAEDDKLLLEAALDKSITSYVCIGEEVGESGTKHYQGYWEFAGKMGAKKIKLVMPRAWYDVRAGTAQKASDYCKHIYAYRSHSYLGNTHVMGGEDKSPRLIRAKFTPI